MTRPQGIQQFLKNNRQFGDYWEMQLAWTLFMDCLYLQRVITQRQRDIWGNPCTPETFKKFNSKFRG